MTSTTEIDGWTSADCDEIPADLLVMNENDRSALERFSDAYQSVHGYLSLAVCAFGIVLNVLNVVVLTRRTMLNATNCLLTALAVTDLLTMAVYVPYAGYFYCYASPTPYYGHRLGWIVYLIFQNNFSITAHTVAVWLTVSIAVFRYIVVCGRHALGARLCSRQRAKLAVVAVVAATVVACVPNYAMYRPVLYDTAAATTHQVADNASTSSRCVVFASNKSRQATPRNVTLSSSTIGNESRAMDEHRRYWFDWNEFVTDTARTINFWLFGVAMKVVPCVVLSVLSALLVRAMHLADVRRRRLLSQGRRRESDRAGERNRTTAMLVVVVLCFVATELPQGVLALLSGFHEHLFYTVYAPLGDVWDILVLINSAVNFVVYCTMNRHFRHTVIDCFGLVAFHKDVGTVSGCDAATELGGRQTTTRVVECRTTTTAAATVGGDVGARSVTLAVYTAMDTGQSIELHPSTV